jgi:hypothetical protein
MNNSKAQKVLESRDGTTSIVKYPMMISLDGHPSGFNIFYMEDAQVGTSSLCTCHQLSMSSPAIKSIIRYNVAHNGLTMFGRFRKYLFTAGDIIYRITECDGVFRFDASHLSYIQQLYLLYSESTGLRDALKNHAHVKKYGCFCFAIYDGDFRRYNRWAEDVPFMYKGIIQTK